MRVILFYMVISLVISFTGCAQNKYIGVKKCKACHQTKEQGKQFEIWQNSRHAEAFRTLSTLESAEIAKAKGFKNANESPECLECHAIATDATLKRDGVQCESCHGAGSVYKSRKIMKDREKAIAAGMTDFKDEASIEKKCRTCHNEKSPTYKPFDFHAMWGDIKHPVPEE
jgi:hypothetical protein